MPYYYYYYSYRTTGQSSKPCVSLARVAPPSEESTSRVGKAARLREKKNKGAVQDGLRNVRMQIGGRRAPIGRVRVADLLRERGDLALLRERKGDASRTAPPWLISSRSRANLARRHQLLEAQVNHDRRQWRAPTR